MTRRQVFTGALCAALIALIVALASCGPPPPDPPPPPAPRPAVDVVGDSTLVGAQLAFPIVGARGWSGSSPLTWPGLIARADSPRVLFVFVGTNGTATAAEQAAAVAQECVGRRCMVTLQGVRPAYDAAMAAVPGVEVCDMSALSIFRPDGVHPDKAGSWHLAQRINECRRDLLAALPTAEAAP